VPNRSTGRPLAVQVGQLDRPLLGSHETFDGWMKRLFHVADFDWYQWRV
jgi:hypothetical protein